MIEIDVRLFGAFRRAVTGANSIRLQFDQAASIDEIKRRLAIALADGGAVDHRLIADSAIADERRILPPGTIIDRCCELAVLPPVCGG